MSLNERSDVAVHVAHGRKHFGDHAVLTDFDLDIDKGEFVALLGASGSGKTTLLRILAELDHIDAGTVHVAPTRSVVFQEPRLIPSLRVWKNVIVGRPRELATREIALAALEEVGLTSHADAWPKTLSGGEAQRVALARALVREPQLLLLDEPFAALDALTRLRMHALVQQLCERHHPAVLLVTHDVDEAVLLADRIAVLKHGTKSLDRRVDLQTPRSRDDPHFAEIRSELLKTIGVFGHRPTEAEPVLDLEEFDEPSEALHV